MKSLNQYITEFVNINNIKKSYVEGVDLGLSVNWATCNVGAEKPEDYGLLFQWGRTDGYKYGDEHHGFLDNDKYHTKSGIDYKSTTLKPEDDAAYQATYGDFRMPTVQEVDELIENTDSVWTKLNGVKGRKFISKKDKSKWIFIPAGGYYDSRSPHDYRLEDEYGLIWSSTALSNDSQANYFNVYKNFANRTISYKYLGLTVRGVCEK